MPGKRRNATDRYRKLSIMVASGNMEMDGVGIDERKDKKGGDGRATDT